MEHIFKVNDNAKAVFNASKVFVLDVEFFPFISSIIAFARSKISPWKNHYLYLNFDLVVRKYASSVFIEPHMLSP